MPLLEITAVLVLVLLNGFFSMSELAVVSAKRVRLQQMATEGNRRAALALELQNDPSRFLSSVQIGITLIGIVNGAIGGATLGERLGTVLDAQPALAGHGHALGVGLVVVAITYLSLIAGELVPKRVALVGAERIALFAAPIMRALARAASPAVWLLGASTELLLRLLGVPAKADTAVTEEEVKTLIAEGTETGVFEPEERRMIEGVLRLSDRTVRSVMTPRPDVTWLDLNDDAQAQRTAMRESIHSRYPVCRGGLDDVVGIVHTRDLMLAQMDGQPFVLAEVVRDALVVHDRMAVMRLLETFRKSRQEMAIVVDEYGSVEGVATLTDVLGAIAGDLPQQGEEAETGMVQRPDGSVLIDGMTAVDEVEHALSLRGLREEDGGFHTLAGFVLYRLGRLPTVGEGVEHQGWRFEVVDLDGRRIDKILATRLPQAEP